VGGQRTHCSARTIKLKHNPLWELACLRRRQPKHPQTTCLPPPPRHPLPTPHSATSHSPHHPPPPSPSPPNNAPPRQSDLRLCPLLHAMPAFLSGGEVRRPPHGCVCMRGWLNAAAPVTWRAMRFWRGCARSSSVFGKAALPAGNLPAPRSMNTVHARLIGWAFAGRWNTEWVMPCTPPTPATCCLKSEGRDLQGHEYQRGEDGSRNG